MVNHFDELLLLGMWIMRFAIVMLHFDKYEVCTGKAHDLIDYAVVTEKYQHRMILVD